MTERADDARSRASWIEALRARLVPACLLFLLAAALPAAAQEGGKGGASSVERAMYERGLELAALGRVQPRDADHYRTEAHYAAGRHIAPCTRFMVRAGIVPLPSARPW